MDKIIRRLIFRLHLNDKIFSYHLRKVKKETQKDCYSYEEALDFLNSVSPDPKGSCVTKHIWGEPDCDLEIIVPCYNVEKYVEKCIDSVLTQETQCSFFVTIINDGSKDTTREVLKKYDSITKIRIIDEQNKGLSEARNTGISQLHGRYVMFLDSDDVLLPNAIENLMSAAEKLDADIVDSGHIRFADPETSNGIKGKIYRWIYDYTAKPFGFSYNEKAKNISGYPWGKVIKRDIFTNVQFPEGYWYEDTLLWMVIEPLCKRKVTISNYTVGYRMNPDSITHTSKRNNKSLDILYVTLQLLRDRQRLGIEMSEKSYDSLLNQVRMNACQITSLPCEVQYAAFAVHRAVICERFSGWATQNESLKQLYKFLKSNDYEGYRLWCKWH